MAQLHPGVFRRESLLAEKRFAGRFGTTERSIQLINDARDRDTYPLATLSGLRSALEMLGERMDRDDDVLILWLTSHGSQEDGLAIENGNLPLAPSLSPSDLRDALDDSGIQWRVIIVSACYSGAFTSALKSPTTLIITASDAEHTSFGCADDRDLTYFGAAFYQLALPYAPTLRHAFRHANDIIKDWETKERIPRSMPQSFFGPVLEARLPELMTPAPDTLESR